MSENKKRKSLWDEAADEFGAMFDSAWDDTAVDYDSEYEDEEGE